MENPWEKIGDELGAFQTKPVGWWIGGLILAGFTENRSPKLIVVLNGYEMEGSRRIPSALKVRGVNLSYEKLEIESEVASSLVISSKDNNHDEMFYALAEYLSSSLRLLENVPVTPATLEKQIREWLEFWSRERSSGSKEQIQGLVGELLALRDWVILGNQAHSVWQGPKGSPHDLKGGQNAVEVKTIGTRTGPLVHNISSIDQLQIPEGGRLYILSFRLVLSAQGVHSVHELVQDVSNLPVFQTPDGAAHFREGLDLVGYSEDLPIDQSRFDLYDQALYEVTPEFPRLDFGQLKLDSRIFDLTYRVDFSGCQEFKISSEVIRVELG